MQDVSNVRPLVRLVLDVADVVVQHTGGEVWTALDRFRARRGGFVLVHPMRPNRADVYAIEWARHHIDCARRVGAVPTVDIEPARLVREVPVDVVLACHRRREDGVWDWRQRRGWEGER